MKNHFIEYPSGCIIFNREGEIKSANPAICQLLNYQEEELKKRKVYEIIYKEPYDDDLNESFSQGFFLKGPDETFEMEKRMIKQNGGMVWVHLCFKINFDWKTCTWSCIALVLNITERKSIELALQKLLRKKETALQQLHSQVKQNLAMLNCLLPADHVNSEIMNEPFQDVTHYLHSMQWSFNTLYKRENGSKVNFSKYLESLVDYWHSLKGDENKLTIQLRVKTSLILDEKVANWIGLLINSILERHLQAEGATASRKLSIFLEQVDQSYNYRLVIKDHSAVSRVDTPFAQHLENPLLKAIMVLLNASLKESCSTKTEVCFNDFDNLLSGEVPNQKIFPSYKSI